MFVYINATLQSFNSRRQSWSH